MFWIILIAVVLFIGFITDIGETSKKSKYSEKNRGNREDEEKPSSNHHVCFPKVEVTAPDTQGQGEIDKKGSVEEVGFPAPDKEAKQNNVTNDDAATSFADDLARSHGDESLLSEKITDLIGTHIKSRESALEFVLQELDSASSESDEAREFAKSLGFLRGEYSGAMRKQSSEDVDNAQQALLKSSISFAISPPQATRLRLFNLRNMVERWSLASPEFKINRLLKILRTIALDDVNLIPSLDASLPIVKSASIKYISNRNKNLDFSKEILKELRHSLGKNNKEVLFLAVPEILEDHHRRKTKLEPRVKSTQETQENNPEESAILARKSEIRSIVEEKGISHLVHFTDFRNLPGIMSSGLVPRSDLEAGGQGFYYNDEMRLDGVKRSISTSVVFPNYRMFFRYRKTAEFRQWVVLIIDKSVLWESDCFFCKHNAADRRIINGDKDYLSSPDALKSMYENEVGDFNRDSGLLRSYDPTDPQAEVLVLSKIPPGKIHSVIFDSLSSKEYFSQYYPMKKAVVDTAFFSSRDYVRKRQVV